MWFRVKQLAELLQQAELAVEVVVMSEVDDGEEIIADLLASTSKRPRPKSQRCRTCNAPNKWETDPPHKKPKGKGDPSCPFPWKEKPDPALIGKQAALELVRTLHFLCTHLVL